MKQLIDEIKACRHCEMHLPFGLNPVLQVRSTARLLIIGQAPGRIVHQTGIPWNDKSGDQLRIWLDLDRETFYNHPHIAIMPMGFCYPGTGKNGDLPPRPECAPRWHQRVFDQMPHLELILLIGQYAQQYYLGKNMKKNLTETVANYEVYLPRYMPLPHPSPRNYRWQKNNPWFVQHQVPILQQQVRQLLVL